MHILEIPSFFPPMGGDFCLEQAKALKACGHQVGIISCNQYGLSNGVRPFLLHRNSTWWEQMDGIEVERCNMRGLPHAVSLNYKRWCANIQTMYEAYCRKYGKPDILHAHCAVWAGMAASQISSIENLPFVVTEHISSTLFQASFGEDWDRETWARPLIQEMYERADCVIHVSNKLRDDLSRFFGKEYKRQVVSNIIDTRFFHYHERDALEGRPFRFCFIGNATNKGIYIKGMDILAKAFPTLKCCELHIAGQSTTAPQVKRLFPSNCIFHGVLDQEGVRRLLHHCDALVLPSRSEAQGLVVLEALSTGMPVVCTDCVPVHETMKEACAIAQTGQADSLAEAMRWAMTNLSPDEHFHEIVEELASSTIVGKQLTGIFTDVIERRC